jgi:polar amino acid transport system ATP-binding protein
MCRGQVRRTFTVDCEATTSLLASVFPELVGSVLAVMRDLQASGMTMVVVSHEMRFAREAAHRVVFMEDGLICDQGPPVKIFGADASPRAREFLAGIAR